MDKKEMPHYTPKQAAKIFQVGVDTIYRWHDTGYIKCKRLPGGQLRIPQSEVDRLM